MNCPPNYSDFKNVCRKTSIMKNARGKKPGPLAVILILLTGLIILITPGCFKDGKKETDRSENKCPSIPETAVPQIVKDSFTARYPLVSVNTWFQKDSIGYCAYIILPVNQKTLAEFSQTGSFIMAEAYLNQDGNFEDSSGHSVTKDPGICVCEIPE